MHERSWPELRDRALELDRSDVLAELRGHFCLPRAPGDPHDQAVYLTGNSLGLQPRDTRQAVLDELDDWALLAVEAHFHGKHPWFSAHETVREPLARLVGAKPHEVVAMNGLTVNQHLLLVSFYRPTRHRYKIVIEDSAFPSDSYAVASQARFHAEQVGFDPEDAIVRLRPRPGEWALRTDDICRAIREQAEGIALVMLGGVNYLTGQWFDMARITAEARALGCAVGWDLAHAAGNVPMRLHEWGPDFAVWCSYKYLNSGPGAVAGAFVHERHASSPDLPRLAGWWGNWAQTRFRMEPRFEAAFGADGWQLSNPPILALAPLRTSLALFERATMLALREKSVALSALMDDVLDCARASTPAGAHVHSITPAEPGSRGCQNSLDMTALGPARARAVFAALQARGVVCDYREPGIVRAAPVPMYNTFMDVWRFGRALDEALAQAPHNA